MGALHFGRCDRAKDVLGILYVSARENPSRKRDVLCMHSDVACIIAMRVIHGSGDKSGTCMSAILQAVPVHGQHHCTRIYAVRVSDEKKCLFASICGKI